MSAPGVSWAPSPTELAQALASRARSLRVLVLEQLGSDPPGGHLRGLLGAFRQALVKGLSEHDFADTYAQTLVYGLLCARWVSREEHGATGERFTRARALRHLPTTSPFLTGFFRRALEAAPGPGLTGLLDDVTGLLGRVHLGLVFGEGGEARGDPVIHFYELFLNEYAPEVRHARGVFYTPDAVVSFMVRSVDEALRTELGLPLGLADPTSWEEYSQAHGLPVPAGLRPGDAVVSLLDPAAGTGTFLKHAILEIHRTMTGHWRAQGQSADQVERLWDDYVVHQLAQRLHGFEVMAAPHAICHLKLAVTLRQTGFRGPLPALNVRLTNSLREVTEAPRPVLVVLGNPPYSGHSANLFEDSKRLVDRYRSIAGEKLQEKGALQFERNLQDDYVKFISLSQSLVQPLERCVWCFVTNHGFIDGPTLSGLRHALLQDFSALRVLNLHGNVNRGQLSPAGERDENVFPIKDTGVAITLGVRLSREPRASGCTVSYADLWGLKVDKLRYLAARTATDVAWRQARPGAPGFLLNALSSEAGDEYAHFWAMDRIAPEYSNGIVTARDGLVIDFDKGALSTRIERFATRRGPHGNVCQAFEVSLKKGWDVAAARSSLRSSVKARENRVFPCLYRPFDVVQLYYHPAVIQTMPSTSWHMEAGDNVAILVPRTVKGGAFQHVMVTRHMSEAICLSSRTSVNGNCFPLWLYADAKKQVLRARGLRAGSPSAGAPGAKSANLSPAFMKALGGPGEPPLAPADVFHYIAAILHSRGYLDRYAALIGHGFPRIPVPRSRGLVTGLAEAGKQLADCYDLRLEQPADLELRLVGAGSGKLERAEFDEPGSRVWINATQHLAPITRPEWEFRIGDYRALERWLAGGRAVTRKGRTLTPDDVKRLALIVAAIRELGQLRQRIDRIVGEHGGWPGAFSTAMG